MSIIDNPEQPLQQQQQANIFGGSGGIFMGVGTPPRNLPP